MDRKKILKWCGRFFAAMLLFTMVSRAASSLNVAQIQTKKIQNKTITHMVKGSGRVEGTRERAVFVRENQLVEEVLVREGQNVKKGDTMLRLSAEQLKKTVKEKEDLIEELAFQLQDLESQDAVSDKTKARSVKRAKEDYNIASGDGGVNIYNAQRDLAVAQKKLADYYAAKALAEETEINDGSEFTDTPKVEDHSQEQALLDEIRMRQAAIDQAVMSRNQSVLAAKRGIEDAGMETPTDSTAENVKRELEEAKEELKIIKKLLKRKGKITAPTNGVIKSISAVTGAQTGMNAAVILYENTGALRVETFVSTGDIDNVKIGGKVTLRGADKSEKIGIVEAIQESETDTAFRKVSISAEEGAFRIGESVEAEISREEGPYSACVPLSALHEDNGKTFVYVVDAQDSVLGEVLVARQVQVTVKDRNTSLAALSEGVLSPDQSIIIFSDREVNEGSRVRLQES